MSWGHMFGPPHIFLHIDVLSWMEVSLEGLQTGSRAAHLCGWPTSWTSWHLFRSPSRAWLRASREWRTVFSPASTSTEILSPAFQKTPAPGSRRRSREGAPLTGSNHARPSTASELITFSSQGLIFILATGMFAWKFRKVDSQNNKQ